MKVILNSDVASLGEEGDVLDVAPGYARNYLLPQGLVLEYNKRNVAQIEERREQIEQRKDEKRTAAMGVKERLETEDLVISMTAGRNGKLFGSVTSSTIADRLTANGIDVERKKIEVPDKSIKAVGNYKVKIRLYGGAEAVLTVRVEPDAKTPVEAAADEETTGSDEQPGNSSPDASPEPIDEQATAQSELADEDNNDTVVDASDDEANEDSE